MSRATYFPAAFSEIDFPYAPAIQRLLSVIQIKVISEARRLRQTARDVIFCHFQRGVFSTADFHAQGAPHPHF